MGARQDRRGSLGTSRDVTEQLSVGRRLADEGIHSGGAFRRMRKALGLRASDTAWLLDVTPETISHWETGKALPTRAAFIAVAAMVDDAIEGRTTTRDRLALLADASPAERATRISIGRETRGH